MRDYEQRSTGYLPVYKAYRHIWRPQHSTFDNPLTRPSVNVIEEETNSTGIDHHFMD